MQRYIRSVPQTEMLANILPQTIFYYTAGFTSKRECPVGGTLSYRDEQKLKETAHRAFRSAIRP